MRTCTVNAHLLMTTLELESRARDGGTVLTAHRHVTLGSWSGTELEDSRSRLGRGQGARAEGAMEEGESAMRLRGDLASRVLLTLLRSACAGVRG